jgi:hypothetical protein
VNLMFERLRQPLLPDYEFDVEGDRVVVSVVR